MNLKSNCLSFPQNGNFNDEIKKKNPSLILSKHNSSNFWLLDQKTPQPVSNILMLPIPDDASTLLCSTEIKRRELTYYVVAVGIVTLPGNGSSNAAASLDHMYVFALGEFGSPQSSVAIGILHFRDHWTGIIAPCSDSLPATLPFSPSLFPLLLHWGLLSWNPRFVKYHTHASTL